jgi:hypothetical protein
LLRSVERKLGLAERLASCIREWRKPELIVHSLEEMLRLRMFAIAAGYEDADDCDSLRHDPVFKMAVGHTPESGAPLCSQPTMSRLENAPSKIEIGRMMAAMVDQFCDSYSRAPRNITLDIDDTFERFTAISSCRCSMLTTTSAASCPSTSTKEPAASRWR